MWIMVAIYATGAIGTFVYNGANSYGPIRWGNMILSALIWPIALPVLIAANGTINRES